MPVTTTAPTDRDTFLAALRAADILTPNQFTKAKSLAPSGAAANAAAALVSAGLITQFQADRLLAGRPDGYVLGQYVVLEQIGRGTMSRVYKAKHRTMNRPVAIKVLSAELTRTATARESFQKEIRAAGKLTHPNIVTAYDANELHGRFYLVLEFVDGPNLEVFVQQRGPLSVTDACAFIYQIATGLQHAHEKGMVHGDIKPANLLVARPSPSAPLTIKIADFGIPKATHGADFAAPEQLASSTLPVDHRADLYSLGCVFFYLLTGWPPFAGGTKEEKIRRHLWEELPPINRMRSDVPPDIAAIVHRLLAKHPAARFASVAELRTHLEATCVPVAIPMEGEVNFDMPVYPVQPGHDSGYLTGRAPQPSGVHTTPGSGTFSVPSAESSPWSQLTDELAEGDTVPIARTETPPPTRRIKKPLPNRERGAVPVWVTASLLTTVVLLSLMGIGAVVKILVK